MFYSALLSECGFLDLYIFIKTLHVISSTILFGTGIGIAFFMFRSYFAKSLDEKMYAARNTVLADYLFTLPAVVMQPLSGAALIYMAGYDWTDRWLLWTYGIYVVAGLCWLPVVWIQIELKRILVNCVRTGAEVPLRYYRLFRIWFLFGWPAFIGLIIVFYLMVAKPV